MTYDDMCSSPHRQCNSYVSLRIRGGLKHTNAVSDERYDVMAANVYGFPSRLKDSRRRPRNADRPCLDTNEALVEADIDSSTTEV